MIWSIAHDQSQGLKYLHSNKIIHRDIKTYNILITKDKVFKVITQFFNKKKIGDLGVSVALSGQAKTYMRGSASGTPSYYAPEIYKHLPYDYKVIFYWQKQLG